jgi:two-component system, cell cycle sensor histidine kinase and response regulator CckA
MTAVRLVEELFRDAPDIVATGDREGVITGVNAAVERLTGFAREEVVGKPFTQLIAPEHLATVAAHLRQKGDGARATVYEVDVLTRDGARIPVEISSTALFDDGEHVGQLAIARDLRDRRGIEEQLRQAQKMEAVGRLGRVVAHDFSNVLLVMRGYGELIAARLGAGDPSRVHAEKIVAEAERAVDLTRRLLSFSREEPLRPREVELETALEETLAALRALAGPGVAIDFRPADDRAPVRIDPDALQQIALNLTANARDAMPDGGVLTIETRPIALGALEAEALPTLRPGRYRLLRFADTGVGMDAATRERAFEPMFTTKPMGQGTGLGLSIVYRLVQQLGGSVTLRSEPGRGAVFSLYLPAAAPVDSDIL